MGAFDDLIPGSDTAPPAGNFDDLVPKRGPIGEIAAGLKRGVMVDLPNMAGHVLQSGELAGVAPGPISNYGKQLVADAEERGKQADYALEPEKHGAVTNALAQGAEILPQIAAPVVAAAAAPETLAGTALAAGASALPFALSAGHETLMRAREKGVPESEALAAARENALAQGALMTAGGAATGKILATGGKVLSGLGRAGESAGARALGEAADTSIVKPGLLAIPEAGAANVATMAGQAAAGAGIEHAHGIGDQTAGEAALESIPGSLGMTALLAPFGFVGAARVAAGKKVVIDTLRDPQADPGARLRAAIEIHRALAERDPEAAQNWDVNTADAITAKKPIELDDSFIAPPKASSEAAPPEPPAEEAPLSSVDPTRGPLSQAAALSEQATLPGFPFTSPEAARSSIEGRGPPPEGWDFDVQRHPSITNRWSVTLKQLTKEEADARSVESGTGPADRADADTARPAEDRGVSAPDVSGTEDHGVAPGGEEAPHLDALAHAASTSPLNERPEPTEAQKAAGNYPKGHIKLHGLDISIENPAGSIRSGTDAGGKTWQQVMHDHYGYIRGTVGRDKDHIDVFVGPKTESTRAFVVDQVDPKTGKFDEHKIVLGADSLKSAREIYQANYEPGWKGLGAIRPTTIEGLKRWFREGDTTQPFAHREGDEYAAGQGEGAEGGVVEHQGIDAGVQGRGKDRRQPAVEPEEGAEAGGGDRALHGPALERVAAAARAVRAGDAKAAAAAMPELDAAREHAKQVGVSLSDVMRAIQEARSPEKAKPAPAPKPAAEVEDFTTRRGEVKTFKSATAAKGYAENRTNRVPGNFAPRKSEDGWVLSREKRERTAAQQANDRRLARARKTFDPERDSLATFLGKMGGIQASELLTDGVDPADLKDLRSGVVGMPAYRKQGGLSMDGMAELAAAHGFDVLDEDGRPDATKMRELVQNEIDGTSVYTPEGYERLASLETEDRDREARARIENDFDEEQLQRAGYDDLSEEGQDLVRLAFDDDLDAEIASFEHAGKGLTDEEADRLFRRSADALPEEAEVAAARGAGEGREHGEAASLREGQSLVGRSAARYGDTEAFQVRAEQGSGPGVAVRSTTGQLDLFTQAPVPRESGGGGRAPPRAIYATQIAPAKRGEVKVGFDKIDTPERAAHVFAGLRKAPREYFALLVLDANDKPIAYLDLFHGAVAETSVYPQIVTSSVFQTPGAKSIWMAHNHPSGVPEPSDADRRLTATLREHLGADLGVDYKGHVIIAGQRAVELLHGVPFDIPAAARTLTVPIMERSVVKSGKLTDGAVSSPEKARRIADEVSGGQEGLLILDHQYRPVAFAPMTIASLAKLRTGDKDTGFGALMQALAKSGGDNIVTYAPLEDGRNGAYRQGLQNLINALNGLQFKLLDAIDQRPGTSAIRGDLPRESYGGFFSRSSSDKKPASESRPELDLQGETEGEIRAREAREAKEAEAKKRAEKAPSEKGFTLTGSDRPVDVAEAHGQKPLFSRASDKKAPVFYSELQRRLEALPQRAGSPQQWKGLIDNLATKGVKRDEIEWSGVKDWLAMQQGKVTKDQVQAFLRDNGVKVDETMLGGKGSSSELDRLNVELDSLGYNLMREEDANTGERVVSGLIERSTGRDFEFVPGEGFQAMDHREVPERIEAIGLRLANLEQEDLDREGRTRYAQYKLPGGENYRELLLTLPAKPHPDLARFRELEALDKQTREQKAEYNRLGRELFPEGIPRPQEDVQTNEHPGAFRSSHFDEPNILAHVRFDERTDAAGKKVLFIEEIQSDWAQKGKREGFQSTKVPLTKESLRAKLTEHYGFSEGTEGIANILFENRNDPDAMRDLMVVDGGFTEQQARDFLDAFATGQVGRGVPPAPFVGKTEAWVALAVKRMIRYAAESGFDRVAWTNGEQQAARYDLSKHISELYVAPTTRGQQRTGSFAVDVVRQGFSRIEHLGLAKDGSALADLIGKDLASRAEKDLADRPNNHEAVHYSGLDLKVGGEGMKAFYDKIIPNVVNDVLKKLGGGRVDEGYLGRDENNKLLANDDVAHAGAIGAIPQPGFDITPAMREEALGGLPLFSRGAKPEAKGEVDVRSVASRLGIDARVATSEDDLPEHLRSQIEAEGAKGDVRGVFDRKTGEVWLVGSNIKSEGEAAFVALHESAHRGLRTLFGEDLNPVLEHIYRTNEAVQTRADELTAQHGYDRLRATEETLADMALRGQARNLKGWQRFVDFIRTWLAKHGFPLKVSDEMAEHIAGAAAQAGKQLATEDAGEARLSRATAAPEPAHLMGVAAKLRDGLSIETKVRDIARGGLRAALGELNRSMSITDAALDQARKVVDKIPAKERWAAMHEYQTGGAEAVTDPRMKPIFAAWKANVDERAQKIQGWDEGYLKEVIPHYFSQMWKDPAKAVEWYQRMMGKGPLEGGKSFLKKRAYASYQEGMSWKVFDDQGGVRYFASEKDARAAARANDAVKPPLEPISQNFIDIAQLSLQQMDKFIAMHEFRQWLKEEKGWVKKVRRGETPPIGYGRVEDPAFRARAVFPVTDKETGKAGAAAIDYDYMVPALIAKDLNNYLSKGLYQFGFWRSFRYAQNLLLSARLGFSAFHAGFTTMDTLVSHADVGARYLLQGDVGRAVKTWGKMLLSPIGAPLEGRTLLKQFYGQAEADVNTRAVLDFLTQGGARGRMNPTDFNNSWAALKRAWSAGDLKGTALQTLPAVMEGAMRPIMHYLVPWQKMTARVLLAKLELDRVAENLGKERGEYARIVNAMGEDAKRQIAYKVVQQVDDRLGQVAYDNLFWNKFAKDVAQASIQSVGWNVGTANVILGGIKDVGRVFKPEDLLGSLDRAGKVKGDLGRVTGRLSYLISLNLTVGMMGAMLQYLMTGESAKDLRDYFFPRTGRKNPDGSDERISMPSYIKDEYALSQHPVTTVQHKLHPTFSMVAELLKNEDFYGNQIVNPDDPWTKIAKQAVAYLGKSVEPYAVQNLQQNRSKGAGAAMQAAPFVGITPAPASVSRTPFESYVAERYAAAYHESLTPESAEKAQSRREAISAIKAGQQPDLAPFSPRERMSIFTAARTPVQQQRFNRLSLPAKISAWDRATPEERAQFHLKQAIARDYMIHGATLDPDVRNKAMEIMRAP